MTIRKWRTSRLGMVAVGVLLATAALADEPTPCLACHNTAIPAVFEQWGMSRHAAFGVGCYACHRANPDDADAFTHHGYTISVIVSPLDCSRSCHESAYQEFSQSAHARAWECVSPKDCDGRFLSCGKLLIDYVEGNVAERSHSFDFGLTKDAGAFAAGINGCWQCHGSEVKILAGGKPDPATWPNAGIGRLNPDGSRGNCASCHQRHTFTVAEARRPGLCGVCHNEGGGEPQLEIYNLSRHGMIYQANKEKMSLASPRWVVGEDYSVAPTCATCHISGTPDMPSTHNVDLRVLNRTRGQDEERYRKLEFARQLTCRCGPDFCSHCKIGESVETVGHKECQIDSYPEAEPEQYMSGVCRSCHSRWFVDNYQQQYLAEVDLIMSKWIDPGRKLYDLATDVREASGTQPPTLTDPLSGAWAGLCNHGAKYAMYGAAMMSPGFTEASNGAIASGWYSSFLPAVAGVIQGNIESGKKAKDLGMEFCEILSDPTYGGAWSPGARPGAPDPSFCCNWLGSIAPFCERRPERSAG